jgi:hypothetical protein
MKENLMFIRCKKCIEEKPENILMEDYSKLQIGFSETKCIILCSRHNTELLVIEIHSNDNAIQKVMTQNRCKLEALTVH